MREPLSEVQNLRLKNVKKTIKGQININPISSKFNQLKELVLKHVNSLMKHSQILNFIWMFFSLQYRLNRNRNGGDAMIFVEEDIVMKHNFSSHVQGLFVELNFRKLKWLLCGTYNPPA